MLVSKGTLRVNVHSYVTILSGAPNDCFLQNICSEKHIIETLRSRFGHPTANCKPRLAVSGFTLSVCSYLGIKIRGW